MSSPDSHPSGRPKVKRVRPTAVDLFAGVGGLSLGFEQAGFDVVAAIEYDPVHAAVHEYNFPLTKVLCADLSTLRPEALRVAAREGLLRHRRDPGDIDQGIDVVFGGPPCQGFSLIGHRALDDPRNSLVFRFMEMIGALRPRYFVMENVPGMRIGGHSSILSDLIDRFERLWGYQIVKPVRVLNAAQYGVPQNRRRLILVGHRVDIPAPTYPQATVYPSEPKAALDLSLVPVGPTVQDAIGDLPNLDDYDELLYRDSVRLAKRTISVMHSRMSPYARRLAGLDKDPEDFSYERIWDRSLLTSSLRTTHARGSIRRFRATPPGDVERISRFLRLDPAGLCNTLRAGSGSERGAFTSPRPIHPHWPRVLSVREAARLHGFPDWFRFHVTKWNGFRSIGNAVPPPLARAIAAQIVLALGRAAVKPRTQVELGDIALLSLNRLEAAAHFKTELEAIPASRKRAAESA